MLVENIENNDISFSVFTLRFENGIERSIFVFVIVIMVVFRIDRPRLLRVRRTYNSIIFPISLDE